MILEMTVIQRVKAVDEEAGEQHGGVLSTRAEIAAPRSCPEHDAGLDYATE